MEKRLTKASHSRNLLGGVATLALGLAGCGTSPDTLTTDSLLGSEPVGQAEEAQQTVYDQVVAAPMTIQAPGTGPTSLWVFAVSSSHQLYRLVKTSGSWQSTVLDSDSFRTPCITVIGL